MAKEPPKAESVADQPTLPTPPGSGTEPKTATLRAEPAEKIGGTIGPYKLLDELGEGGMGTVYLAEQERPVRRRVALKVIKPGLDTAQVIARFEAERQALALMDHPNIARVVDAGTTTSGRPYFVMELVQGVPITAYCDSHRLPLQARLALFVPVCRAVQHAHQKGIIHRDLKPSNILVTLRDDHPVPKIIDFGIAKATTQRLTERTLYTQYGQLVGTPDYMSPEQAGRGGIDVDTRSDVYSLGAILYELLCGETPLGQQRLKQLDFMTMIGVIHEDEPPPPSRRVADLGDKGADVARRRETEPSKLVHNLRGELDWIVTKALEKERTRRYESPSALAADIERHLHNQPVEASPPSATYRLQKFVRRNRAPLAAAATIALVLIGGIVVSGWQAYRAKEAEQEMGVEREAAIKAKSEAERLLKDVDASRKLAEGQKKLAEETGAKLAAALAKANDAAKKEGAARAEIERRLREADAMRLAMNSQESRARHPQRSLLLAAEAVEATRRKQEPIRAAAHQALRAAIDNIGGRPMAGHEHQLGFMATAPNGRWLFTGDSQTVRRWDLAADDPAQSSRLVGAPGFVHSAAAISPDGRWLATMNRTVAPRKAFVWDLQAEKLDEPARGFEFGDQYVDQVRFSGDSTWLIGWTWNTAWLWNLTSQSQTASPIVLEAKNLGLSSVAVAPGGRWAVTQGHSRVPHLWSLTAGDSKPAPRPLADPKVSRVDRGELSPDGRWLVSFDQESRSKFVAKFWDLGAEDPFGSVREVPLDHRRMYGNTSVHFSANGQWMALAEGDRIRLWDLAAEKWDAPKSTLSLSETTVEEASDATQTGFVERAPTDSFQKVVSDRDGRSLLAIDQTGSIHAWKLNAKDPNRSRLVVGRHAGGGNINLELSASGRWLVSTREGEPPRLWDLWRRNPRATGLELRGHDGASFRSTYVAFGGGMLTTPSSALALQLPLVGIARQVRDSLNMGERWLVTRGYDATPRIWDLTAEDLRRAGVQTGAFKVDARDLAIREDGNWVIWQGFTQLQVIDPDKNDRIASTINVRTGGFGGGWSSSDRSLSRDGRWLALRTGQSVGIYDLASEQFSAKQVAAAGQPQSPAITQRADEITSAKKPAVWQPAVAGGRWLQQFLNPPLDNRLIAVPGVHQAHSVVEIEPNNYVNAIIVSASGRWLLIQTGENWRLWSVREKKAMPAAIDMGSDVLHTSFSPNDRWLVSYKRVSETNRLEISLWDLESSSLRRSTAQHELGGSYSLGRNSLAFSGDCRWLASSTGGVRIWPIAEDGALGGAETLSAGQQSGGERGIAVSGDGRFVAAAESGAVRLWDRNTPDTAVRQRDLHGHEQGVSCLAFSPDGAWLVSASHDGEVRLWDLRDEQLQDAMIALAIENERQVHMDFESLQFGPDGRWLAAGTHNGAYFWRLDPISLLDEAHRLAGRELYAEELARYRLNSTERQRERLLRQAAATTARLKESPQDVAILRRRTDLYAFAGELKLAIDDLRLLTRLEPDDHWLPYHLITLLAHTGQPEEYRRAGEAMASHFRDPPPANYEILERVAKACLFWGDSGADWKQVAPLADRALQKSVETKHWVVPWAQVAKGLAEYRLGNYAQALEWADKGLGHPNSAGTYSIAVPGNVVKAMSHAQLGQLNEALAALASAKKAHAAVPTPLQQWNGWNDWYMCEIMLREADALLLAKSPPADIKTASE